MLGLLQNRTKTSVDTERGKDETELWIGRRRFEFYFLSVVETFLISQENYRACNISVYHCQWICDNPATFIFERYILDTQCINLVVEFAGGFIVFVEAMFD